MKKQSKKNKSIKGKLIILFSLMTAIMIITISLIGYTDARSIIEK